MTFNPEAIPGDFCKPDGWKFGEHLIDGDSFSTLRIKTGLPVIESLAVEVAITGRVVNRDGAIRAKITFKGDGEPDQVARGWLYRNSKARGR